MSTVADLADADADTALAEVGEVDAPRALSRGYGEGGDAPRLTRVAGLPALLVQWPDRQIRLHAFD